jgi:hypothetical protein
MAKNLIRPERQKKLTESDFLTFHTDIVRVLIASYISASIDLQIAS